MLDRRAFLRVAGVAGVAGVAVGAAGCDHSRAPAARPGSAASLAGGDAPAATTTATATGTAPGTTGAPTATTPTATVPAIPDWPALAGGLSGALVRPDDREYDTARRLYNTRFDGIRPQAVLRASTPQDVREAVLFARRHDVALALRSGGHSYAGFSNGTGLVVDVSRLDTVRMDGDRVVVGAGARLIDVYAGVAAAGRGVPAGSCPTVGITGLTLGGGVGVLTRAWGLTCDNLVAADVVTADGRLRTCDARRDPDLYWALRGGGGGNFGAVTSLTLRTHPAGRLSMVFLSWPWRQAAAVVRAWQSWLPGAPDEMWSNVHLLTSASGTPAVTANAFYLGDVDDANRLVDRLVAAVGTQPASRHAVDESYLQAMRRLAGCGTRTVAQCHLPAQQAQGTLGRETYAAKSHILTHPLPAAGVTALVAGVDRLAHTANAGRGGVLLDALGGAVSRLAPDATAYPHRRALAMAQYLVSWSAKDPASMERGSLRWLRGYHDSMSPYVDGGAYVNYIDPDLRNFGRAYYGTNYQRLRRVKATYDPDRLFAFSQGVTA